MYGMYTTVVIKKVPVFKPYYGCTAPPVAVFNPFFCDTATVARQYRLHGTVQ